MKRMNIWWEGSIKIDSRDYICGHCGKPIASNEGYFSKSYEGFNEYIYICHYCIRPTYFDFQGNQVPGPIYGKSVNDVPDEVKLLYDESRNCISCNAYTASVLCSRKLLMNIAVSKGADEGLKFYEYVNYLSTNNYTPPDSKDWVDHIRIKGNEATHEISIMDQEDATELISFTEMLLKFIYEFPASIKKKSI